MPYLDSNVFIYSIAYDPEVEPKAKRAKDTLLNVENGKISAYTSTLTWDEVVWIISKTMGRREGLLQGQKLLDFPNIHFVVADENVLSRAQRLINRYNTITIIVPISKEPGRFLFGFLISEPM